MRKIMAVFAHPDDEGAISGTLYRYAQMDNTEVVLVCATRGEVGQISDPALATPETLGDVRTKELEAACDVLGIQHLEWLDYRDSGMEGTPQNDDPQSLVQADVEQVVGKIVRLIEQYQPDIVVTFEPFGWYGHPDHRATSRWTTQAHEITRANGHESLLLYAVIAITRFKARFEKAVELGIIEPEQAGLLNAVPYEQQLETENSTTHAIDVTDLYDIKMKSMASHATQFSENHPFRKIPRDILGTPQDFEYFIQVSPQPAGNAHEDPATDLFDLR